MNKAKVKAIIEAIVNIREVATDEQALTITAFYPEWRSGVFYRVGQRVMYKSVLYNILQPHTSQDDWTPDIAVSLFAKVLVSDDGKILPWEQPDSTNPYKKGDKVSHNDKVWESLIDNNVWEPGAVGTETLWSEVTA